MSRPFNNFSRRSVFLRRRILKPEAAYSSFRRGPKMHCCLLDCINELNICSPKTRMTAICTSVRACHVLIRYQQYQKMSDFNPQLQGLWIVARSVWDIPQHKRRCFS